ncbi:undecaprenyl/decaprenyl-phosphate alpha-N-acetylglucosaminyl 1-phosphate transferase [Collinsella sp. zg1085]|uniref:glycosyltransferase family 4 protein n=1 Tax=Collinsella sp. zg1085 TaxID=2844380 RepID=UPI001C0CF90B|nr:MraY family glycosyltransferase [Collinsella sp. zg1085]QWT18261.1 undecaprenyl/decaprenyl-phosphate alpha-N-acetylglucosaminyl 1-phosphate transferase [Collinsella sp. zg1085]
MVVTLITTPLAKRLAISLDAVDYPSKRRINKTPIPRLGGLAVFCGIAAAVGVQVFGHTSFGWAVALVPHPSLAINYPMLALAFLIMVLTGAVDDVIQLSPRQKLAGQILAAILAAASGLLIQNIVNPLNRAEITLGFFAYPLTVIYLVAYTNIINLIDGLDGLATGVSAIAGCSMFSFSVLAGRSDAALIAIALIGACLGFLYYNFHPASIFLGDSGALLLGFALGSISLLNVSRVAALTSVIMPLIVAGVPIIDTFSAIIRRKRAHMSIGQADTGHIHHRLIQEGFDQRQAVLLIYAWTILLSIGAALINQVEVMPRILIFIVLLVSSAAFALRLHLFDPVLLHHYNPKTPQARDDASRDEACIPETTVSRMAHKRRVQALKLATHKRESQQRHTCTEQAPADARKTDARHSSAQKPPQSPSPPSRS